MDNIQLDIQEYQRNLKVTDFENFMSVYKDKHNNYCHNLNETLYLDFDKDSLPIYVTKTETHWSLISYELYETVSLAWLLMKVNEIKAKYMFDSIPAATVIKYLTNDQISKIMEYIGT